MVQIWCKFFLINIHITDNKPIRQDSKLPLTHVIRVRFSYPLLTNNQPVSFFSNRLFYHITFKIISLYSRLFPLISLHLLANLPKPLNSYPNGNSKIQLRQKKSKERWYISREIHMAKLGSFSYPINRDIGLSF